MAEEYNLNRDRNLLTKGRYYDWINEAITTGSADFLRRTGRMPSRIAVSATAHADMISNMPNNNRGTGLQVNGVQIVAADDLSDDNSFYFTD